VCNNGITHFYLPPSHSPYLSFAPQLQGVTTLWLVYSLRLPMNGWPGWVDMGGWSHTEINTRHRELNPDTVTHPSTNRARRIRVTSLMCATPLPSSQAATLSPLCAWYGRADVTYITLEDYLVTATTSINKSSSSPRTLYRMRHKNRPQTHGGNVVKFLPISTFLYRFPI